MDELRTATVICTVSFTEPDREAVPEGGCVYARMERYTALRRFINDSRELDPAPWQRLKEHALKDFW